MSEGGPSEAELSSHPADRLIRAIIRGGAVPSAADTQRILRRMSEAPLPATQYHLRRRLDDEQWRLHTTEQQYLDDIRNAIRDLPARLGLYERRGGTIAAIVTETARVVPAERLGPVWLPVFFVAYSADRGIILTGYQASTIGRLSVPEDVQWLK